LARLAVIAVSALLPVLSMLPGAVRAETAVAACRADQVLLRGPGLSARFSVELADTDAERAQGLMFRRQMATGAGMLFVYPDPQRVAFWMRNTYLPLDMIFVDAQGVVRKVHPNAVPLDETPIWGGDGILAVLEINAGLSARLGIVPGSEMRHPAFGSGARWPC
jgi:uncharacterized membrane protein (UPF0127 family)